jgi:alkylation response protein AidB-like acyl-CoA dehydrogenase
MDVRYSPEQQALRDSAAQVVDRLGPRTVRDLDDSERVAKLDAAVEASGWRELRLAGERDEPLASAVEAAIIAEELSRGPADVPFLGPTLAAELRRLAGAPPAGDPETVALVPDLSAPAVVAGRSGPANAVAVDAGTAVSALVLQPAPGGHILAQVRLPAPPGGLDLTRPVRVVPAGTPLEPVGPVGPVGDGAAGAISPEGLQRWVALTLALTSAELVGAMRGAVALACEYAKARQQYGTPIGSFQAVQHLLADAQVALEGSRSVALHAAWAVDVLPVEESVAAGATAKAYCARSARAVCETAIQVHGGIGNTWECLAHVYLRRALLSSDVMGGVGANLARVLAHHRIGGTDGLR